MSIITVEQACQQTLNRKMRRKLGLPPVGRPGAPNAAHVHVEIKKVAEGMAHVLFDEMMGRNEIFSKFKDQHPDMTTKEMEDKFVAHLWPQLIEPARATLAGMLRNPSYSEEAKEEIMDILVKDQTLVRGRKNPAQVLGTLK